ncbi:MAG: protein-methionine-sulfoxide reductase catalytic subunit MsrP [Acidobacteria bacterium]|nr:protein-methionine-sulfoxide reductase catalytic subunit MsrP [Acidobacteriota bacterium]
MLIRTRPGWELPESAVTPEKFYLNRRQLLAAAGFLGVEGLMADTAKRNPEFSDATKLTPEFAATGYNNFYELHPTDKEKAKDLGDKFITEPWSFEVSGLVNKPKKYDLDDIRKRMPMEERIYRFRCVETWAMVVPWTGFPISQLIKEVEPKPNAKYLRFVTANRPDQFPGMKMAPFYPWPYHEGLRMDEAMNPLAMFVTGIYGKPLPKQNGAPIRVVTPWKYGYKSIKAIVKIEFTEKEPPTFWNKLQSSEYGFYSNVEPGKPHPRWSQANERLIPTGERQKTLQYNGYEKYVAGMYNGKEF